MWKEGCKEKKGKESKTRMENVMTVGEDGKVRERRIKNEVKNSGTKKGTGKRGQESKKK